MTKQQGQTQQGKRQWRRVGLAALGVLLLPLWPLGTGVAQTAPASSPVAAPATPQKSSRVTAQPITPEERRSLATLFEKVRPATLRIEECPVTGSCAEPEGVGSAFLISPDGLALTAYHVVFGARNLSAVTLDRQRHAVQVIGFDDQHDMALIRVEVPKGTPHLPLTREVPKPQDLALVVGNGNGQFFRSATGRLLQLDSAAGRADFPPGTLELSARLLPGDSGGVVVNEKGEAVGIVSYIRVSPYLPALNRSYAVPVTAGSPLLADLKGGARREAPVIGVSITPALSSLDAEEFALFNRELKLNLGDTPGAFFTAVAEGSPAARAGLKPLRLDNTEKKVIPGDVVTAVNGKRIINFSEFQYAVREYQPGQTITLTVLRDGKELSVPLTLVGRSTVQN